MHTSNSSINLSIESLGSSNDRMDGVTTQDASFEYNTRAAAKKGRDNRDRVNDWINSPTQERESMLLEAINPVLDFISSDPVVAQMIYDSGGFKSRLTEFIVEGQREAQEIQERLASANIDIHSTEFISFSNVKKEYLQERMNVSFEDATAIFEDTVLHSFLHEGLDRRTTAHANTTGEGGRLLLRVQKHSGIFKQYWNLNVKDQKVDIRPTTVVLADDGKPYTFFLKWLDLTMQYTPHSVEASSRRIIDALLLGLTDTLAWNNYEVVHIPELKVRRNATSPIFTITANNDAPRNIILSGSVDYAFVTRNLTQIRRFERSGSTPTTSTSELILHLQKNQDAVTLFEAIGPTYAQMCVLFIEAKKPPPQTTNGQQSNPIEWLVSHEGQAVAEAMAGLKCQEDVGNGATDAENFMGLPWGLTDGVNWVFGMVVHIRGGQRWTSYRLATAKNDRRKESSKHIELTNLMAILHILSIFNPGELWMMMGMDDLLGS